MALTNPFSRRLYLRIWLAVVGGVAVFAFAIGIAFLLSFLQIALTLGNFLALFRDFLLMFGFELTVAAVRSDFTKRFVQTINPVLVVMFFGVANLPLDILLFFLTGSVGKGAGNGAAITAHLLFVLAETFGVAA